MTMESSEDRRRAEDVYDLLVEHKETTEKEIAALRRAFDEHMALPNRLGGEEEILRMVKKAQSGDEELRQMKATLELVADHVIGPIMRHATGEPIINGHGLPMRDQDKGLITVHAKLDAKQIVVVSIANLAIVVGAIAAVVSAVG